MRTFTKVILDNGMTIYEANGQKIAFNLDFKMPRKAKSMFQILQNVAFEAQPSAYCSKLSYVPAGMEDFLNHLDKFLNQSSVNRVNFHCGRVA